MCVRRCRWGTGTGDTGYAAWRNLPAITGSLVALALPVTAYLCFSVCRFQAALTILRTGQFYLHLPQVLLCHILWFGEEVSTQTISRSWLWGMAFITRVLLLLIILTTFLAVVANRRQLCNLDIICLKIPCLQLGVLHDWQWFIWNLATVRQWRDDTILHYLTNFNLLSPISLY